MFVSQESGAAGMRKDLKPFPIFQVEGGTGRERLSHCTEWFPRIHLHALPQKFLRAIIHSLSPSFGDFNRTWWKWLCYIFSNAEYLIAVYVFYNNMAKL